MKKALFVLAACLLAGAAYGADLDVNMTAALEGTYGLEVNFDNLPGEGAYVQDDTPNAEQVYRASFLVDTSPATIPNGDRHTMFFGRDQSVGTGSARVELRGFADDRRILCAMKKNSNNFVVANEPTKWMSIPDGEVGIMYEVEYLNNSAGGGMIKCTRLDTMETRTNDAVNSGNYAIDLVRMGPSRSLDATTTGSAYFDDFQSFRTLAAPP